jgi:NADPH-dependent ferric siderophore reductase
VVSLVLLRGHRSPLEQDGRRPTLDVVRPIRARREPPLFRVVEAARVERRSPHMARITLTGPALEGLDPGLPAASVRVLLPADTTEIVMPTWNGNEFLLEDGSRPIIRTLTPLRFEPGPLELDIEIVRHGQGPLSAWADAAKPGDRVAVSGTGRGYEIEPTARAFLLAGDESALPAISVLLRALPPQADVQVLAEVRNLAARLELPFHPGATVQWNQLETGSRPGDSLVAAVTSARLDRDVRVWAAGEAAAVQRIRRHLSDERGLPRSRAVVRGYWKYGRGNDLEAD